MNTNSPSILAQTNDLGGATARYQSNLIGGRRRKSRTARKNHKSSSRTGKKSRDRSHRKKRSVKFMVPLY